MANNYQGRNFKFEIFDTTTNTWKVIGGIKTKDTTRDNPVEDATNAATTGNETESQYTGYSTETINGSGVVDSRANAQVAAYKYLARIARSADPTALFKLTNPQETISGRYSITSFGTQGSETELIKFSIGLQSASAIEYV